MLSKTYAGIATNSRSFGQIGNLTRFNMPFSGSCTNHAAALLSVRRTHNNLVHGSQSPLPAAEKTTSSYIIIITTIMVTIMTIMMMMMMMTTMIII